MSTPRRSATGRVTISDIAERAGVSIGAVSFALNGRKGVSEATRERVLRVADELGWAPSNAARSLAEAKTETFGLVLARDPHNLGVESFYMEFFAGLEIELSKRGYSLLLQVVPSVADEIETLRKWRRTRRVDGVILTDLTLDDPRVALIAEWQLPAVVVGDPSVAGGLTNVWTDDATSMREAVRHLAELGHRRIARVSGLEQLAHTRIRDEAYRTELVARGLEPALVRTDWSLPGAASSAEQLRYYEEMFRAVRARPWVRGLMLWDWPARLYPEQDAAANDDYCPYGKPAGAFMATQYREWST